MSAETLQLITVIGGLVSTLAAVALTHYFVAAGEKRRVAAEDRRRWHDQRYRTVSDLIAEFMRADYRLSDLANLLREDVGGDEGIRRSSVRYEDDDGQEQIFEPDWIQNVISDGREIHRELDEAHRLVVDLSVVASGPLVDLAWEVLQGYTDSAVAVWHFAKQGEAWDPLTEARVKQKEFVAEARGLLGADLDLE